MYSKFVFVVLLVCLCGCGASGSVGSTPTVNNPSSDPLAQATPLRSTPISTVPPTPTQTLTPTATTPPTLTPIPAVLGETPTSFADHEIAIINDRYVLQLLKVEFLREVEGLTLPEGKLYMVLQGYLYNYADQEQEFHDTDFRATFDENNREIMPDPNLMHKIQAAYYPSADYPDRNRVGYRNFIVPAKTSREIILAYEVPNTLYQMDLEFTPKGQTGSTLGVFIFSTGGNQYQLFKKSINDQIMYTVGINTEQTAIETVIDSEIVEVDNCFGTTVISRAFTFSEEIGRDFQLLEGGFSFQLPMPFSGILEANARSAHGQGDSVITRARTETLSAGPGTRPQWQMSWYRVSIQGALLLTLNGELIEIPYQLTNELRSDLVSIPSSPCLIDTPTR